MAQDDGGATGKGGDKEQAKPESSPEAKMNRRFPQKVRTGDLVGLPIIDNDNRVFGRISEVVRTPQQKIELIVAYDRWFGFGGRLVAVPIEVVAIVGRQVASMDMPPDEYKRAPTWSPGSGSRIPDDEIIRIAITRR